MPRGCLGSPSTSSGSTTCCTTSSTIWKKRCEPVSLNKTLRKIRFLVPVHTEVTPGERPLERPDLAVLERLIPGMKRRHFHFLGRLTRFIIPGYRYERAPFWRRMLSDVIRWFDRLALSVPIVEELGGVGILYGHASHG
jgi:hypothetical protein